ncbi:MAG: hypothetical protein WAX80_00545, partial [Minisyncoccia bacterium]
ADLVLPIIADCESGDNGKPGTARQFEADGVTPYKNREGSSAFGKYQFLESHREPALALGYDLDTEQGQDDYSRHLYNGPGRTGPWEHDPRSVACWEPKLLALGYTPSQRPVAIYPFTVTADKPFVITVGPDYRFDWWGKVNAHVDDRVTEKVVTLTVPGDENVAIRYRFYACTTVMPCEKIDTIPPPIEPQPPAEPELLEPPSIIEIDGDTKVALDLTVSGDSFFVLLAI